jgi:hypothetical protein
MIPTTRMLIVLCLFLFLALPHGRGEAVRSGEIRRGVRAEGACAIVGMSAEQSQLTALQRARAAAIEQAAGVALTSGTLVTNFTLAADFIKTYARGFIVSEKAAWLPLGQYQKDSATPPIPEYRVRIAADVYVPSKRTPSLGLQVKLNSVIFRSGEKALIAIRTARETGIALFNIRADDRVALLFPNAHEPDNVIAAGKDFVFPGRDAKVELEMQTLPGHRKDAEAFFVVAWERSRAIGIRGLFPDAEPMQFSEFFRKLMEIADHLDDAILPYEVVGTQ